MDAPAFAHHVCTSATRLHAMHACARTLALRAWIGNTYCAVKRWPVDPSARSHTVRMHFQHAHIVVGDVRGAIGAWQPSLIAVVPSIAFSVIRAQTPYSGSISWR